MEEENHSPLVLPPLLLMPLLELLLPTIHLETSPVVEEASLELNLLEEGYLEIQTQLPSNSSLQLTLEEDFLVVSLPSQLVELDSLVTPSLLPLLTLLEEVYLAIIQPSHRLEEGYSELNQQLLEAYLVNLNNSLLPPVVCLVNSQQHLHLELKTSQVKDRVWEEYRCKVSNLQKMKYRM